MHVNPMPDEDQHKQHQLPEPSVVAAISLAARADAWVAIVSTMKSYAEFLFRDHGLAAGESALDRVQEAISSIFPPQPTHGHEKRRKGGQKHGDPNPISNTPPLVGALGRHLTRQLEDRAMLLKTELKSASPELRRAAIESQLTALEEALCSGTLHRLCARIRRIIKSNRFKASDNVMNQALLEAKSFSIGPDDDDLNSGWVVTGREMQRLSPDQPDQLLQARQLRKKILACCDGDDFLRRLIEYKFANSFGRNRRALSVDEIASASDGPFADEPWSSLSQHERKAKIYKANEKLVAIKRRLKKEGELPNK
jgi:hypothetical protein